MHRNSSKPSVGHRPPLDLLQPLLLSPNVQEPKPARITLGADPIIHKELKMSHLLFSQQSQWGLGQVRQLPRVRALASVTPVLCGS